MNSHCGVSYNRSSCHTIFRSRRTVSAVGERIAHSTKFIAILVEKAVEPLAPIRQARFKGGDGMSAAAKKGPRTDENSAICQAQHSKLPLEHQSQMDNLVIQLDKLQVQVGGIMVTKKDSMNNIRRFYMRVIHREVDARRQRCWSTQTQLGMTSECKNVSTRTGGVGLTHTEIRVNMLKAGICHVKICRTVSGGVG
ncbi:hypothetical protein B0H14DRAFT_3128314 [Mycena olivaceomarginata]|nr:hypothetical protein B0H14DRAFT_3128314 [Mycena olivaceomarginata]